VCTTFAPHQPRCALSTAGDPLGGRGAHLASRHCASHGLCEPSFTMDVPEGEEGANLCPYCSRQFVLHGNLLQHMMTNHLEEMGFSADAPSTGLTPPPVAPAPLRGTCGTPASAMSSALPQHHVGGQEALSCNGVPPAGACNIPHSSPGHSDSADVPGLGTTAEKVRSYYAAFGDMGRTRPLVSSTGTHASDFVTDELKDMRMFALSAGGKGLSQKARAEFYTSTVRAERAALRVARAAQTAAFAKVLRNVTAADSGDSGSDCRDARDQTTRQRSAAAAPVTGDDHSAALSGTAAVASSGAGTSGVGTPLHHVAAVSETAAGAGRRGMGVSPRRKKKTSLRRRIREAVLAAQAELEAVVGPLEAAFPTEAAFLNSLKGETARCLSEQGWRVTDIVDGDDVYKFYSRNVMQVALNCFMRATSRVMRGERKYAADGSVHRTGSLDSDLYLREQADVDKVHAGRLLNGKPLKVFTMATQFFSDATLVSKNGGACFFRS